MSNVHWFPAYVGFGVETGLNPNDPRNERATPQTNTGWKPMLHYTVAWSLWVRGIPIRKHFERSLDTPGDQCSIGFQPVSGFRVETGLNPNDLRNERATPQTHTGWKPMLH